MNTLSSVSKKSGAKQGKVNSINFAAGAYFLRLRTATSYSFSFSIRCGHVRNRNATMREISFDRMWTEGRMIYEFR